MDPRNLYTLRYREGFGPATTFIVAANQQMADAVGKRWCQSRINCRFIRTEPSVSADETILTDDDKAALAPKEEKEKTKAAPANETTTAAASRAQGLAANMGAPPSSKKAS